MCVENRNLLMGWNPWSVFEYLMTGESIENTCWQFRHGYYKHEDPSWLSDPFEKYSGQHIEKVFAPSSLYATDYAFIKTLGNVDVYYLEEGEYDYVRYDDNDKHMRIPFYTMNPDAIANPDAFSEIRQLTCTQSVIDKFLKLYNVKLPMDKYDVILYTDPIELDFGTSHVKEKVEDYMQKYHGNDRILVKTHPLDTTVWNWDVCSPKIPAQLLLNRNVVHVFMYKTTVLRYIYRNKEMEMINII